MAKEIRIGEDQRFEKLLDNERQKLQSEYAKQVALDIEEKVIRCLTRFSRLFKINLRTKRTCRKSS